MAKLSDVVIPSGDYRWDDDGNTLILNWSAGVFGVGRTTARATVKNATTDMVFLFHTHHLDFVGNWIEPGKDLDWRLDPGQEGVFSTEALQYAMSITDFAEVVADQAPSVPPLPTPIEASAGETWAWLKANAVWVIGGLVVAGVATGAAWVAYTHREQALRAVGALGPGQIPVPATPPPAPPMAVAAPTVIVAPPPAAPPAADPPKEGS